MAQMPSPEERSPGARGNVSNGGEAAVLALLLHTYTANGVSPANLGVISAYRAQLERVRLPPTMAMDGH